MKNLAIKTQNTKGNEPKYTENLGYVTTFLRHSGDKITVDDFEGQGDSYKQREFTKIEIVNNGETLFSGDKYELFEILRFYENNKK